MTLPMELLEMTATEQAHAAWGMTSTLVDPYRAGPLGTEEHPV